MPVLSADYRTGHRAHAAFRGAGAMAASADRTARSGALLFAGGRERTGCADREMGSERGVPYGRLLAIRGAAPHRRFGERIGAAILQAGFPGIGGHRADRVRTSTVPARGRVVGIVP